MIFLFYFLQANPAGERYGKCRKLLTGLSYFWIKFIHPEFTIPIQTPYQFIDNFLKIHYI